MVAAVVSGLVLMLAALIVTDTVIEGEESSAADALTAELSLVLAVGIWAIGARALVSRTPALSAPIHAAGALLLVGAGALSWAFFQPDESTTSADLQRMLEPMPQVFTGLLIVYGVEAVRRSSPSPTGRLAIALIGASATAVALAFAIVALSANPATTEDFDDFIDSAVTVAAFGFGVGVLGVIFLLVLSYVEEPARTARQIEAEREGFEPSNRVDPD